MFDERDVLDIEVILLFWNLVVFGFGGGSEELFCNVNVCKWFLNDVL